MRKIEKTLLATHDPASMADDEGGIAYDDSDSLYTGTKSFDISHTGNVYPLKGLFKITVDTEIPGSIGLGRTNWGAKMQAEIEVDETDPDTATLAITDDTFVAGKVIGLDISPKFNIDIKHIHYHWFSHSYDEVTSFSKGPYQFDAIAFLATAVGKLMELGDIIPCADILVELLPKNVDTGAYHDTASGIAENEGKVSLNPKLVGDIDLVSFILTIGEDIVRAIFLPTGPGELVVDFVLAIGDIELFVVDFVSPQIAFGPSFGFESPVDINISEFSVGDSRFIVQSSDNEKSYGTGDGNTALPVDISNQNVSVEFHADSHYKLLGGAFIQISWLKVLSFEKRKVVTLVDEAESTRDSEFYNLVGAQDLDDSSIYNSDLNNVTD